MEGSLSRDEGKGNAGQTAGTFVATGRGSESRAAVRQQACPNMGNIR